jgi:hypothetical protein
MILGFPPYLRTWLLGTIRSRLEEQFWAGRPLDEKAKFSAILPFLSTTLWQGIFSGSGLLCNARPTMRAVMRDFPFVICPALPAGRHLAFIISEISPYVATLPFGIFLTTS